MSPATPFTPPGTTIVVPTIGRPSLQQLIDALLDQRRPINAPVYVVDDRPAGGGAAAPDPILADQLDPAGRLDLRVLRSGGRGPAAARNVGWRRARTEWVSFLDDDVVPAPEWYADLVGDLRVAGSENRVGSQGRISVPLNAARRPTDAERGTAALADAPWITADLTYRRTALRSVGGFDERFQRAYREDSDLALRLGADRGTVARGQRQTIHPARTGGVWTSVRQQRGNADDQLMRRLHGARWRRRAQTPTGRLPMHAAVTATALAGAAAALTGRRRLTALGAGAWTAASVEFAWARIRLGPRDADEIGRMVASSLVIPPVAVAYALAGRWRHRRAGPWRDLPDAILVDRDGTLVENVPYNGDPDLVRPVDGARAALDRLRDAGIKVAVISNQSGVGSGRISHEQVADVNARVDDLLGPFDGFYVCPHGTDEGCTCRKPQPGLVHQACRDLGVRPERCVVVGDIGSDVGAAEAAGAEGILVPTADTAPAEVTAADRVAEDLETAVTEILGGHW